MKSINLTVAICSIILGFQVNYAQSVNKPNSLPKPSPTAPVVNPTTPKISELIKGNLGQITDKTQISRERREQALIKLLESQRHIWRANPSNRRQSGQLNELRLAKQALQQAIEFDPTLAEAYTTLAELTSITPPNDVEEAILLAGIAVRLDAGNFGGHRLLARLYTIKSRLNNGILEMLWAQKAIAEWKEVARLDSRNAEAFAFLSEFYAQMKMPVERLDALRKWQSASAPLETRFYVTVFNGQSDLSTETATVKYGGALLENGENREAIEVLSRAVADNPENGVAVELLKVAVDSADAKATETAIQFLRQAVFANPENAALMEILAKLQMRTGQKADALQTIRAVRVRNKDNYSLLRLEATILAESGKIDEAVALIKSLIGKKSGAPTINENNLNDSEFSTNSLMYDDFSNLLFIANLYSHASRDKEAIEAVNQAMAATQISERKEIAKLTLATIQQSSGDFRGAEATLRGILVETPRNPIALNNLGYFLAERGEKLNEALKLIEQALEIDPNNPSYLDSMGWAYFKLGKLPEAEKYLKDALRFERGSSTIYEHLGDVYDKQGKSELARTTWQKALSSATEPKEIERIKVKLAKMPVK